MTVSLNDSSIALSGQCGVEEVETLVGYLERRPGFPVDIGGATEIHTALWQAMIAFKANIAVSSLSSPTVETILAGLNAGALQHRDP